MPALYDDLFRGEVVRVKVSIIIPCYNQAWVLPSAIISALAQNYLGSLFEVIVIDDGSTDNTREVAEKEWPGTVRYIRQANKGLPSARNTGVMNARGQYILPLDADDEIHPDYLAHTIHHFSGNSHVGVVYTGVRNIGDPTKQLNSPSAGITLDAFQRGNQLYYCSLIRREALLECGGYNPRMIHGYEDWDLWIDLCKRGWKFVYVPGPLFRYRARRGTMIEESDKWREWNIEQIKRNHPGVWDV